MKSANFEIPEGYELSCLIGDIERFLGRVSRSEEQFQRSYYDTFDWRLYASGYCLSVEKQPGQGRVKLQLDNLEAYSEAVVLSQLVLPRFVWELPPSFMRTRLEPILDKRALIPLVGLNCRRINLKQLNKNKKTVLRLYIEAEKSEAAGNDPPVLVTRLCLVGIKGYDKAFDRAYAFLKDKTGLPLCQQSSLLLALSVLGRQPLDYSSKLRIKMDPQMRSDAAAKQILSYLLKMLEINQPGIMDDLDSEFLHDFRVAIRRTRTILSQIRGVFPVVTVDKFAADFACLGSITSPLRDLDVYLLKFDQYKSALPFMIRDDLDPLRKFIEQERLQAQKDLIKFLRTSGYRSIIRRWRRFLDAPVPEKPVSPNAMLPIAKLANQTILRLYNKVLKDGRQIQPDSPAETLHNLRKTCKKLRYMIEFFQCFYANTRVRKAIGILKALQDNLGDFQDYEVQEQSIKRFSQEMMKSPDTAAKTLLAMGVLVLKLQKENHCARIEFSTRFEAFSSPRNRALFMQTFTVN